MDAFVPHELQSARSLHPAIEAFWFWLLVPEHQMTCLVSIMNRSSGGHCALGVFIWDNTSTQPELFPYATLQVDLPELPDHLGDVVIADMLRLTHLDDNKIRLRFIDQGVASFDITLAEISTGHLEEPAAGTHSFTGPMTATGVIELPHSAIQVDSVAIVRRTWGPEHIAEQDTFGCVGASPDLSFFVQWALEEREGTRVLEGFVHRDGVSSRLTSARRVVTDHRDGYPSVVELTMTDELGRTTIAFGDTANTAHFRTDKAESITSLTDWTIGDIHVWGGHHETLVPAEATETLRELFGPERRPDSFARRTSAEEEFSDASALVVAATRNFCQAIEAGDFEKMQSLWERTRRVVCVLPGRRISRGWTEVAESWISALESPADIVVGNLSVSISGDLAWVHYDCDRLENTNPPTPPVIGVASTTYACTNGEWLIVAHHASTVSDQSVRE